MARSALLAPLFCAAVLVLCSAPAFAVCLPGVPAKAFVGNKPADAACDYDSIQDAIDHSTDTCSGVILNITPERDWINQALIIPGNRKIILKGWGTGETCSHLKYCTTSGCTYHTSPRLVLIAASSQRVISIEGPSNNVTLDNLEITGGAPSGGIDGGGIFFTGSGTLTVIDNWIHANSAASGGGIAMLPTLPSTLTLQGSMLSDNQVTGKGGGLLIGSNSTLYSDYDTSISNNHADGSDTQGGGIDIESNFGGTPGPAAAYISSLVDHNVAKEGGGIYADGASVNLYDGATLDHNTADQYGGGIMLQFNGTHSVLCASDFDFGNNSASNDGAAIYAYAGYIHLNDDTFPCAPGTSMAVAHPCTISANCNDISYNTSPRATVMIWGGSSLNASRLRAQRNQGGAVFSVNSSDVMLQNCLVTDNDSDGTFKLDTVADLKLDSCTFANNAVQDGYLINQGYGIAIDNSIISSPEAIAVNTSAVHSLEAGYDLVDEGMPSSLTSGTVWHIAPQFVNSAGGDYHQLRTSGGVDYAPAGSSIRDLDGYPRTVELGDVVNHFGPMDLGAYEIQYACVTTNTIFCDGFDAN